MLLHCPRLSDNWFYVHCFPQRVSDKRWADSAPVRGKGGGQGREGQSVLALWEGEGVPVSSSLLFLSNEMLPREEGGTQEQPRETGGVLQEGDGHSFPLVGHPLRQQTD